MSSETRRTKPSSRPAMIDPPDPRGGRVMMPRSAGSYASARDSVTAVTMLTQSTWTGVSGRVSPKTTATRMTSDCAPLVGNRNTTDLRRLS